MTRPAQRSVELRNIHDASGSRFLEARLEASGDLLFEGQDLGAGVEEYFGAGLREYEWSWTVRAQDIHLLEAALGVPADLLEALGQRFSGDAAAGLVGFLRDHDVPYESWSRVGD